MTWNLLWAAWIVAFLILEGIALYRKERGDTLSENTWKWFSLKGDKSKLRWWQYLLRVGFFSFWIWLTVHFLTGGRIL